MSLNLEHSLKTPSLSKSRLLVEETPLQLLPTLATKVGLNEAIILQQMHYWLTSRHNKNFINNRTWVYNSYEDWHQQFPFWSKETIKRTIYSLEKQKLIVSCKLHEQRLDHRKWYTINYQELKGIKPRNNRLSQNDTIEQQFVTIDRSKMTRSNVTKRHDHYKEQRLHTEITHKTLSLISPPNTPSSLHETHEEKREEIGLKMIEMFSKHVLQGQELLPHPERMSQLKHALNTHLKGNLENWERVCINITKSKFLMGEAQASDFKATLDWVITKDHAIKIFEGNAYGIGDRVILNNPAADSKEAQEAFMLEFTTSNKHPLWIQAGLILSKKVGFCIFKGWISVLDILEIQNDHVTLIAPSKFIRDYVSKNLMNLPIQQALESVLGYELRFVLVNTGSNLESKPEAPQGEAQHTSISAKVEEDSSQVPALSEQNAVVSPPNQPQIQNLTAPPLDINKGIFPPLRNPFFGSSDPPLKPPNTQELQNEYN
ncbi:MAG: hypothetical protein J0H87_07140 [Holosporales bacterium]|nr:hypothetical protein [Holosporales bacterium]